MSDPVVIAVDGGNSKTDLALIALDGTPLALVRGPGSSPHHIGPAGCVELLGELLARALEQAGTELGRPAAAALLLAGADLASEEQELTRLARRADWADELYVGNDTLAVLRAGSSSGYGVAVVCGAGINALALSADGRQARFPALGAITGDWGGGADLGLAALGEAIRAEDGRGGPTVLARLVPEHFELPSAQDVALAIHRGELDQSRLVELAPVVLGAADGGDHAASGLRERQIVEIVAFVRAAAGRVLQDLEHFEVVLGGSVIARDGRLGADVAARLRTELPASEPRIAELDPVAGSALIALEMAGAGSAAAERLRSGLRELAAGVAANTSANGGGR
jgi:N-acetylglucosamine kinase-like BadF-type ATPase